MRESSFDIMISLQSAPKIPAFGHTVSPYSSFILFSVLVKCEELNIPTGGSLELQSNGLQTVANITCVTGSTLNGGSEIKCRSDGTWDVTLPKCGRC